jgi:inosose dehydratase
LALGSINETVQYPQSVPTDEDLTVERCWLPGPDFPGEERGMANWVQERSALFGIQWYATADGWLDRTQGPSLPDALAVCRGLGFRGFRIEVPPELTVAEYAAMLADHDLSPAPGYLSVAVDDDGRCDAASFERARQAAAVHAEIGLAGMFIACGMSKQAARVALHPARGFGFEQDRLERVVESIAAVAEVMCAEGVRPGLHPHVGTWVETEDETRYVLDNIDATRLAFGPDTGHLAWAGVDPAKIMADYRDRINHVHIKDINAAAAARSATDDLNYQQTVLAGVWMEPGLGDVDLEAVLDVLGPQFDGWLVSEVDRPNLPTAEQSIAACARWFQASHRCSP